MRKELLFSTMLFLLALNAVAFENFDEAFNQMRHRYALGHYKRVIAITPDALKFSKNNTQKFKVLYFKGLALDALLKFWQAEQIFEEASKIKGISEKQKLQAVYNLTRSQFANKHYVSALANAEKYSESKAKTMTIHLNILQVGIESAQRMNKSQKALQLAEKLCKKAVPDSSWYYRGVILRVRALCAMKKFDEAEKIISKEKLKKVPLPMHAEFLTWSGYCYEKESKPEIAGKYYAQAYDEESNYYAGLAALRHANLLGKDIKHTEKAEKAYERVLKIANAHPEHKSQAIYKAAAICRKANQPERAVWYLAQIDDIKHPAVYWQAKIYNLHGDILYTTGQVDKARKYFKACLNLSSPQDDSKLYAKEILAQLEEPAVLPEKE